MREIFISTETGSDLPQELVERFNVKVVPMHVVMDNTDLADGSFPVDDVYDYYKRTKKIPTTSATNVAEYQDFFTNLRKQYPDCVLMHMAYSSQCSCTYQNAEIAIRDFDDIYLIDTQNVSGGCTAHIAKAYEIIQSKKDTVTDYKALADKIQAWADKVYCSFIPGNLDFLKAGGRVSNAQYLGATLLHLKPLIEIDQKGHLIADKKYRGATIKFVEKYMQDIVEGHHLSKEHLYLMYSKGCAQVVLDKMKEIALGMGFEAVDYVMTGCVISCHSGPGAIGLAGYGDSI